VAAAACAVTALLGIGAATALADGAPPPPPPPPPQGGGGSPPPSTTTSPPVSTTPAPPPDTTPPGRVAHLKAITSHPGRITLTWSNPGASDLAGIVVRRSWGACPQLPSDGVRVGGKSVRTRQVDTGAANGATYCYGVFAFDASGNHSRAAYDPGVMIQAVVVAPKAVTGLTATVAGKDVVLNWHNPVQSGLRFIAVRRGVGTACPTGPADGTQIGGEVVRTSQIDTTAQAGVTYCYRVYALDSAGGASATRSDANVTTPAPTHTHATANSGASSSSSGWMTATLTRAVAGIVVVMLLVMAVATAVTRRRSHASAYVAPRDLSPRLAISGYPPVALVIPAILVLGTCAALVLILINL
jgi:hypothetical protein